jgi:acyl carrier protein
MSDSVEQLEDMERWVVETSRDLKLHVGTLEDDFFDVGGTSLTMMRFISRVETHLGVALDPDDILASSTLRGIAATIFAKEDVASANQISDMSG